MADHDTTPGSGLLENFSCLSLNQEEGLRNNQLQDSDRRPARVANLDNSLKRLCVNQDGSVWRGVVALMAFHNTNAVSGLLENFFCFSQPGGRAEEQPAPGLEARGRDEGKCVEVRPGNDPRASFRLQSGQKFIDEYLQNPVEKQEFLAEFQRITTVQLEPKNLSLLDLHTPKLQTLFHDKGGTLGERLKPGMELFKDERCSIDMTREVVIHCIIEFHGEHAGDLIKKNSRTMKTRQELNRL